MEPDLAALLQTFPQVARPIHPPEPLGNAGGLSGSRLWRYRSGLGLLVARAWPIDGPKRPALEQIHAWLDATAPLSFVPRPLRARDGQTLQALKGRLWEVTPWMPGAADLDPNPAPIHVRSAFAALAALHQRLGRDLKIEPSPGLHSRLRELDGLILGGFTNLENLLKSEPADPVRDLARQWVELARRFAGRFRDDLKRSAGVNVPCQPCLRDVRPDHFLFEGSTLTGLVDFGAMGVDTIAADLARLASEWLDHDLTLRPLAFEAYHAIRPIRPEEATLISAFERSAALLGAGHWVRWQYVDRRTFDDPLAVRRGLEKGLARLLNATRS